jgi:hypothetical protein
MHPAVPSPNASEFAAGEHAKGRARRLARGTNERHVVEGKQASNRLPALALGSEQPGDRPILVVEMMPLRHREPHAREVAR